MQSQKPWAERRRLEKSAQLAQLHQLIPLVQNLMRQSRKSKANFYDQLWNSARVECQFAISKVTRKNNNSKVEIAGSSYAQQVYF
jgi:hypothetical protein